MSQLREVRKLRELVESAVVAGRLKQAAELLERLEQVDPHEARWPQRLGDIYRRLDLPLEAVAAYGRAINRFAKAGYMGRAVGMAAAIANMDPATRDALNRSKRSTLADGALDASAGRPLWQTRGDEAAGGFPRQTLSGDRASLAFDLPRPTLAGNTNADRPTLAGTPRATVAAKPPRASLPHVPYREVARTGTHASPREASPPEHERFPASASGAGEEDVLFLDEESPGELDIDLEDIPLDLSGLGK